MVTKHITVRGNVQGVGYRMSMLYAAKRLGLTGWVRNRQDGSVEAMAQGTEADVDAFIDWAHQGPELARIESVDVSDGEGQFAQFEIRNSA